MWVPHAATSDGTVTDELTTARGLKMTWRLDAPGEAEFTLQGKGVDGPTDIVDQTGLISPLATDLLITYNGQSTFGWRGRCGPNQGSLDETTHSEKWSAVDYRGMLARRYVRAAQSFTGQDTGAIARELVIHAQTGTAGPMGVGIGEVGSFVSIDKNVPVGKSIGEQIDELGDIYPGFDWWVDADMQANFAFRGGTTREFALEHPTTCSGVSWQYDHAGHGNTVIGTGGDATTPSIEYAADLASRPEGRWEIVASNPDVDTQTALNATTNQTLRRALVSGWSHTFTLRTGPDYWTPERLWVGDFVHCRYQTSTRSADFLERVYEISVSDDGNGQPVAQVSVGNRLAADLAALRRSVVLTLNKLARR